EALGIDAKVGMLQRPERVVLLSAPQAFFGLMFGGRVLAAIIILLTITAWITVVQRVKFVFDYTRSASPAWPAPEEEPTDYKLWERPSRRDTTARAALKGE